jgi:hypothetical protein
MAKPTKLVCYCSCNYDLGMDDLHISRDKGIDESQLLLMQTSSNLLRETSRNITACKRFLTLLLSRIQSARVKI